jgi:cytochrome c2
MANASQRNPPNSPGALVAPSLERLGGLLSPEWLQRHLAASTPSLAANRVKPADGDASDSSADGAANGSGVASEETLVRRMPYFALKNSEVADLAAYLLSSSSSHSSSRSSSHSSIKTPPRGPDAELGRVLLRTIGCLACHTHDGLGTADLLGGGDLSSVGDKWNAAFFPQWLTDPHAIRPQQRMPVFELSNVERDDLTAALIASRAQLKTAPRQPTNTSKPSGNSPHDQSSSDGPPSGKPPSGKPPSGGLPSAGAAAITGDKQRGAELFASLGCAACHRGPTDVEQPRSAPALNAESKWDKACVGGFDPDRRRPAYFLTDESVRAVRAAIGDAGPAIRNPLREQNCLRCHARDTGVGLAPVAQTVVARHAELAPLLPALTPPSLTGVGDKLRDEALNAAIRRVGPTRRPWLAVRMPRFDLSAADASAVARQMIDADRVPPLPPAEARASRVLPLEKLGLGELELRSIAGRLITPDGFGCTSCHPAGGVQPPPAPLNARGPDLTRLGDRLRAEWYDRWVRAPARIVPRMEMPSVQIPVRGVLGEQLDAQLAAVWHGLHLPDFRPPEPNPVRTLRLTGDPALMERAEAITDVVQAEGRTWVKPLLIGLPNRHNVLFDFETNRIARWSLGDLARQRTKGKSWHWEAAGVDLWGPVPATLENAGELLWEFSGQPRAPILRGQFPSEPEWWRFMANGIEFAQRLRFVATQTGEPNQTGEPTRTGAGEPKQTGEPKSDNPSASTSERELLVVQTFEPTGADPFTNQANQAAVAARNLPPTERLANERRRESGFRRTISVRVVTTRTAAVDRSSEPAPLTDKGQLRFRIASELFAKTFARDTTCRELSRVDGGLRIVLATPNVTWEADGSCLVPLTESDGGRLVIEYRTALTNDRYALLAVPPLPAPRAEELSVAPGFVGRRLPLDESHMPTALTWRPDGTMVIASLKGQVLEARDTNGDGLEDRLSVLAEGLAAPYGIAVAAPARIGANATNPMRTNDSATFANSTKAANSTNSMKAEPVVSAVNTRTVVDVATKTAVLRLWDEDGDQRAERIETVASGWGHTVDYHDWTVGLPSDGQGGYYVGLACEQDKRSLAAARWRGTVLRLTAPAGGVPLGGRFGIKLVSGGHRFPMGLARNRAGELFATDNQGNFNPFNELNHVRSGLRFGFLNSTERRPDFQPPTEPPVIDIPHPWTRSVNGICFLEADGTRPFGPFTGHLVGCEYDTRRLVRMSLQPIGGTFQGAVYPLTYDQPRGDPWLLGPICCAVAPNGDLVVGGIRDSGWGGGNNLGEIVRLRFDPALLPAGIAEVRAVRDGFQIDFTQGLERERLASLANYSVVSYRRESTSAYGGPDLQRRDETVRSVEVAGDRRSVRLRFDALRAGFVYELRLRNLVADGTPFHPAEAYFTLRQLVNGE